ncbi:MAG: YdcF family protein [Flavobacteriia bacterium]|jgi:uncharacterized SAM-binding protein YcdF (DUF218 family)
MFFLLSKALAPFIAPFTWFAICLMCYLFWRKEPWKKRFKWITIFIFIFFTNTAIFLEFARLWEIPGTRIPALKKYDVGIVLTGMGEYNNDLGVLSIRRGADRIWQALTLYHKGKIKKILITGDSGYITDRGLHEAKQVKEVLVGWGMPEKDIITEEVSKNTYENAVETKKLLDRSYPNLKTYLLITSGKHMRRANGCFEKQGLKCGLFSTDLYTGPERNYFWDQYLIPNYGNFEDWETIMKEIIGYAVYDIAGYI